MSLAIAIDRERIEAFCRKWKVKELAIFGSALRQDDFRPDSDVDVLVVFQEDAEWGFEYLEAQDELAQMFGRKVDLVERSAIFRNPFRKRHVLANHQVIYGP